MSKINHHQNIYVWYMLPVKHNANSKNKTKNDRFSSDCQHFSKKLFWVWRSNPCQGRTNVFALFLFIFRFCNKLNLISLVCWQAEENVTMYFGIIHERMNPSHKEQPVNWYFISILYWKIRENLSILLVTINEYMWNKFDSEFFHVRFNASRKSERDFFCFVL